MIHRLNLFFIAFAQSSLVESQPKSLPDRSAQTMLIRQAVIGAGIIVTNTNMILTLSKLSWLRAMGVICELCAGY
jgi:hypothetical protein